MAPTTDPKRLQVLDRFFDVLDAIEAGDNYFYTPHEVKKALPSWENAKHGPLYCALPDSGGVLEDQTDLYYEEEFFVSVKGIVHDREDLGTILEQTIRDVRYAIDTDSRSGAAGTLSTLCLLVSIDEPPEVDYFDDFGFFDQRFRVRIAGNFATL